MELFLSFNFLSDRLSDKESSDKNELAEKFKSTPRLLSQARLAMNPYTPPANEVVDKKLANPFAVGFRRAIVSLVIASISCFAVAVVAKVIDWLVPGEGNLHDVTMFELVTSLAALFSLLIMISFFSTFAHYAGDKQVNAGLCVIVVFSSGLVAARVLTALGYVSPGRARIEDWPDYVFKLSTYFVSYALSSAVLTFIGYWLSHRRVAVADSTDRSDETKLQHRVS